MYIYLLMNKRKKNTSYLLYKILPQFEIYVKAIWRPTGVLRHRVIVNPPIFES